MKTETSPPLLVVAILISGTLGFFVGQSTSSRGKTAITATEIPKNVTEEKKEAQIDKPTVSTDVKEEKEEENITPESQISEPVAEIEEPEEIAVTSVNPTAGEVVLARIKMGISDQKLSQVLESIAENMENKKLAYISNLSQDCSGIFHQIKDSIQVHFPSLTTTYQYPIYTTDRSSRQIADWYHKKGNLLIIKNPLASRNSIRPGSVMFFGKSGKKFENITIEQLTDRDNNYTRNGIIEHIAVVTSVRTDKKGNVKDYTMMHARYPNGPAASRSGSKEIQSKRTKGLPAFGNWKQQWVAVANIATPK